ncbi:polyketide cyclase/dehydrase and lipid transport [Actinomyces sp. 2119]|uniref:Polyketide cyclase/dehydrase and lipid transport n=1 Tax=Actinomyces lilanjuaniae TaxID=2321394 RepID=A0ABM6Z233_9ACTO|nr:MULTISPECIES: SRPBCC family protein [Actinomyces]AYD89191.1 polyketide cyclase/dehydrase and lipid transport [Actinomyces lilanjuaniae]RJF41939.1 polyketide cyclase/dehydrase and lipid transport [Actinomyces sp. 2119]
MWTFSHSEVTAAAPERVWQFYADPAQWKRWDPAVRSVSVDGPVRVGTRGRLRPASGPTISFTFTEVTPGRSFTDTARLPLARLQFFHTLEAVEGGTRVTHGLRVTGPLTFLFSRLVGAPSSAGVPQAIRNLVRLAEEPGLAEP